MGGRDLDQFAYGPIHVDHLTERAELKPGSVGVVAWNSWGHDEAKGEQREAANLAIAMHVLFKLFGFLCDLLHESGIFELKVLHSWGVGHAIKVQLKCIFQFVDDLL